ncbi:MAG: hypothetical protein KDA66_10025 [Planctomycetaceae bacterium]|nr:hypothetical protein [Planctomycetaceae bacterium]
MPDSSPGDELEPEETDDFDGDDETVSPALAAYNTVTDTVTGVNVRMSDNVFQAIFIFVSAILVAIITAVACLAFPGWQLKWYEGVLIGAFGGVIFGVFASGTILMVYRAFRHLQGKHD